MGLFDKKDKETQTTPPVETPTHTPTPTPAPEYISKEAFEGRMARLEGMIEGIAAARPSGPTVPAIDPNDPWAHDEAITEEDEGDKRTSKLIKNALRPLVNEFRSGLRQRDEVTFSSLDQLSTDVLMPKMKHYTRYKKDIDAMLANMAPHLRARPDAKLTAYRMVVAEHIDELEAEANEAGKRSVVKDNAPTTPKPVKKGRTFNTTSVPTPQELGITEEQVAQVEEKFGGSWDMFAQKTSRGRFKTYEDWAKSRAKMLGYTIEEPAKK